MLLQPKLRDHQPTLPQPHHRGLGTISETGVETVLPRSWGWGPTTVKLTEHVKSDALMNSLKLLLAVQVPHKIEPLDISSGKREELVSSPPFLKDYWQLMVTWRKNVPFFNGVTTDRKAVHAPVYNIPPMLTRNPR